MGARSADHAAVRSTLTKVLREGGFVGSWGLFRRPVDAEHEQVVFVERIRFLGLYRVYYSNHFQGRPTQMDRYTLRDHLEILQAPRPVLGATDMFLVADWVDPSENPAMHEDVLAPTDELVDSIVTALRTAGIDIDR